MTKEEFEQEYAENWGITVKEFYEKHRKIAIPCDCGEPGCQGWQMVDRKTKQPKERREILTVYPVAKAWRARHPETGKNVIWVNDDNMPEPNSCMLFPVDDPRLPPDIETCPPLQYALGIMWGRHQIAHIVFGPHPYSTIDPDGSKFIEWSGSVKFKFDDLAVPDSYLSSAKYKEESEPTPPP